MGSFARINLFFCTAFMANYKYTNRLGYQQRESGGFSVYRFGFGMQLSIFKRVLEMASIKWAWILADILGIPIWIMGIVANFDNVKSTVLFIVGLIYLGVRVYFYFVQKSQAVREKEIELWHLEQNKLERIKKNRPKI